VVTVSDVLVIVAIICFALATFERRLVPRAGIDFVAAGLALWALSTLV
jgi:hypothetical protein